MKLVCSQKDLAAALNAIRPAVTKSSLMVLQNVMLDATDGFTVSATNLEIGIRRKVGATVQEEGKVLVPHALFSGVVKAIDGEVSLRAEGNSLWLECGKQSSRFATDSTDFPAIFPPFADRYDQVVLSGLKDMVRKVAFSAATDPGRPVLEGVLIESGEKFRMVTADGYRLSIVESEGVGEEFGVLVPLKAMKEVAKMDGEVTLARIEGKAVFRGDGTEIVSLLIDGRFPKYQEIVPKSHDVRVLADADGFRGAVKTVSLFGDLMKVNLDGNITLSSETEMGDGRAEFEAEIDGGPLEFSVNGKYLGQALEVLDEVVMEAQSPNLPIVFRGEGWTHVLMPMMGRD